MMEANTSISYKRGHYEGYINGIFACSGDTYSEVEHELEECLAEKFSAHFC